jgi:hypothetical protein
MVPITPGGYVPPSPKALAPAKPLTPAKYLNPAKVLAPAKALAAAKRPLGAVHLPRLQPIPAPKKLAAPKKPPAPKKPTWNPFKEDEAPNLPVINLDALASATARQMAIISKGGANRGHQLMPARGVKTITSPSYSVNKPARDKGINTQERGINLNHPDAVSHITQGAMPGVTRHAMNLPGANPIANVGPPVSFFSPRVMTGKEKPVTIASSIKGFAAEARRRAAEGIKKQQRDVVRAFRDQTRSKPI